jgi:hypothetical protein
LIVLFSLDWESRRSRLPTRSVQHALLGFTFRGVSEYLEDFVARIVDAPHSRVPFLRWKASTSSSVDLTQYLEDIESAYRKWVHLPTLKDIYPCETSAQQIPYALKDIVDADGNFTTEVLPTLQNIFLKEISPSRRIQIGIMLRLLVDSRELSGHPI